MFLRTVGSAAFILGLIVLTASSAAEREYPAPQLLVEVGELAKLAKNPQLVVLDARTEESYRAGHLPGAVWVDHEAWSKAFEDGGNAEAWSKRIGGLGVDNESTVVVYDDLMNKNAARIWWILRYYGHDDARLLNGGWAAWSDAKGQVSQQAVEVEPARFMVKEQPQRLSSTADVLAALKQGDLQILDARSFGEHCGTDKLKNARGGAIPGAKHLEWSDLLDAQSHRFKTPAELRTLFQEAGVDLKQPTATHCQSGGRAAVMAFGLELMGAKQVRNYYRGWSAWGNSEETPVEQTAQ